MAKPFTSMPGPRSAIRSLLDYTFLGKHSFDRLHLAKKEKYQEYGRIYRETLAPGVVIVQVFDPDDMERVFRADGRFPVRPALPITVAAHERDGLALGLGSLNGEQWYVLRQAVHKLMLRPSAATAYLPVQNEVASDFTRTLAASLKEDGEVPDFSSAVLKYAMESIGTVCYGSRLGLFDPTQQEADSKATTMLKASSAMFEAVQKTSFAFPWFRLLRTPLYRQFIRGRRHCDSTARQHMEERMSDEVKGRSTAGCPNFIGSLMALESLTTSDIVGLTTDLFTAGIDSTANALSFAIYNIARNPDKQEVLWNEIQSVMPSGAPVTHQDINNMRYLKACVKESFRLNFPVEGGTIRVLETDLCLSGYHVPKGTVIAFNHQTTCLQEEYFDRAAEFIPERWLKGGSATLRQPPKFVMLPFGYGSRMCIGRRFAEQEIYLALIKILQAFRVEYHHEEIGMINRVFTAPDRPLRMRLISRHP